MEVILTWGHTASCKLQETVGGLDRNETRPELSFRDDSGQRSAC